MEKGYSRFRAPEVSTSPPTRQALLPAPRLDVSLSATEQELSQPAFPDRQRLHEKQTRWQ